MYLLCRLSGLKSSLQYRQKLRCCAGCMHLCRMVTICGKKDPQPILCKDSANIMQGKIKQCSFSIGHGIVISLTVGSRWLEVLMAPDTYPSVRLHTSRLPNCSVLPTLPSVSVGHFPITRCWLVRCHAAVATLLRLRGNVVMPPWQRCYASVATHKSASWNGKVLFYYENLLY